MSQEPNSNNEMTVKEWRLRLWLYLTWIGCGAAMSGLPSLPIPEAYKQVITFLLGIVVPVVGAWRAFIDKSTPTLK